MKTNLIAVFTLLLLSVVMLFICSPCSLARFSSNVLALYGSISDEDLVCKMQNYKTAKLQRNGKPGAYVQHKGQ